MEIGIKQKSNATRKSEKQSKFFPPWKASAVLVEILSKIPDCVTQKIQGTICRRMRDSHDIEIPTSQLPFNYFPILFWPTHQTPIRLANQMYCTYSEQ